MDFDNLSDLADWNTFYNLADLDFFLSAFSGPKFELAISVFTSLSLRQRCPISLQFGNYGSTAGANNFLCQIKKKFR